MRKLGAGMLLGAVASCAGPQFDVHMMLGGTQSLFQGEHGAGQYHRDVEATTGEKLRRALRMGDRLDGETLNRMAVQLSLLRSADPAPELEVAVARQTGYAGRFLRAGIRRYAFVARQAAANPVDDPCGYTGPLLPGDGEKYDPRELCWWRETLRQSGVPAVY